MNDEQIQIIVSVSTKPSGFCQKANKKPTKTAGLHFGFVRGTLNGNRYVLTSILKFQSDFNLIPSTKTAYTTLGIFYFQGDA